MPRYRITIFGQGRKASADLVRKYRIEVLDHGIQRLEKDAFAVDALVDDAQIRLLQAHGYKVERHEDVDEAGKLRQEEVGKGNRYEHNEENDTAH